MRVKKLEIEIKLQHELNERRIAINQQAIKFDENKEEVMTTKEFVKVLFVFCR